MQIRAANWVGGTTCLLNPLMYGSGVDDFIDSYAGPQEMNIVICHFQWNV